MKIKQKLSIGLLTLFLATSVLTLTSMKMEKNKKETQAYLEITLDVKEENRGDAAGVYVKYKEPV
jgi:hypothetical protein